LFGHECSGSSPDGSRTGRTFSFFPPNETITPLSAAFFLSVVGQKLSPFFKMTERMSALFPRSLGILKVGPSASGQKHQFPPSPPRLAPCAPPPQALSLIVFFAPNELRRKEDSLFPPSRLEAWAGLHKLLLLPPFSPSRNRVTPPFSMERKGSFLKAHRRPFPWIVTKGCLSQSSSSLLKKKGPPTGGFFFQARKDAPSLFSCSAYRPAPLRHALPGGLPGERRKGVFPSFFAVSFPSSTRMAFPPCTFLGIQRAFSPFSSDIPFPSQSPRFSRFFFPL